MPFKRQHSPNKVSSDVQKHTDFNKHNKERPYKLIQTHECILTVFVKMRKRHLVGGSIVYIRIELSQHLTAARLICNLERQPCHGRLGAAGDSGSQELVKVNVVGSCVNGWDAWKQQSS